jgi:prepilin-type N-terminal cleavage/methylation domain-containing protein
MRRALHRLQRCLLDERGYSLVELMIVMVILGIVLGSLTTVFVSGTRAELELNERFQAQQNARLALDAIRRETHCAQSATVTSGSVTLILPSQCPTAPPDPGSGPVTWCAVGSGLRWGLYRQEAASCGSAAPAVKKADYLTTGSVFSYLPPSASSLAKLQVNFPVDIDTSSTVGTYRLTDGIALRNNPRMLNPPYLSFGDQAVPTSSIPHPIALSNPGSATLSITSISITSGSSDYSLTPTHSCPGSLAPNASCTINVTFRPTVTGARSGTITITDSAADSPQTVSLTGTGT